MSFESEFNPYKKKKDTAPKSSNSSFEAQFSPQPKPKEVFGPPGKPKGWVEPPKPKPNDKLIKKVSVDQFRNIPLYDKLFKSEETKVTMSPDDFSKLKWYEKPFVKPSMNDNQINVQNQQIIKKQEENRKIDEAKFKSKTGSVISGAMDTITLGLLERQAKAREKETGKKTPYSLGKESNPNYFLGGQVGGYLVPGLAAEKAAGTLIKGVNLGTKALRGAVAGGGMEVTEGLIRGESAKDIAKRTAIGVGFGIAGESLVHGGSKLLSKYKKPTSLVDDVAKATPDKLTDMTKANQRMVATTQLPKVEEKIILSNDKKPFSIKNTIGKAYKNVIDDQYLLSKISKDTKIKASNSRQSQGIADFIAENGLTDINGVKVGKSLQELTQELPLGKEQDFWRYMAHKHNVSRAVEGKNVFSQFNSEDSMKTAQDILVKNPEFEEASKNVTKWINDFMDEWAVKSGLISEDTSKLWKATYPDYFPIYRELAEGGYKNLPKNGFVNQHNLVKKAKGAKEDLSSNIRNPLGNIAELVNKTVKAAKNNEVGNAILDAIEKGGLDDIFEVIPSKKGLVDDINKTLQDEGIEGIMTKFADQFDDAFNQAEKGGNIVKVMRNGQAIEIKVKDMDFLKALQSLSEGTGKSAPEEAARFARKITRPIKDLITGKNPFFAIFNMLKDSGTALIQGVENNPIKFALRYTKSFKEIVSNSKGFQEFVAQGGMQSGFFKNDILKTVQQLKNPKGSPLERMVRKVEAFNNLTEATPRYMEYMATLEKGGTKAEAIYNAAEVTVNFARSGKWGKLADSFILYLNPALQGLDKMARQIKNKPLQTLLKGATVITAPQIITDFVNKDNPNFQRTDQRTKDDFFLIPKNNGPLDENGYAETFYRIPKARQYSVLFGVLINRATEIANGKSIKDASKGVVGSINRNFSVPTRPFWAPFSDVKANKDWKDAPINPLGMQLDNRSNYLKYDETTSEVGKVLSKLLNEQPFDDIKYSPKDIDYLIDSFSGILGDIGLPLATKNKNVSDVFKKKFITDSVYSNQETTNFYENLNKARTAATDKNILESIPSKLKTKEEAKRNTLNKLSEEMTKLNKQLKQSTNKEEQREIRKKLVNIANKGNILYNDSK